MSNDVFSVKFGGAAGQGIKSMGLIFAKLATRSGYHVYNYIEYPSLIRGGHNVMEINFSPREVTTPKKVANLEINLGTETNVVVLTRTVAMLGGSLEILKDLLLEEFHDPKNLEIATEVYNSTQKTSGALTPLEKVTPKIVINANDAVALGAIAAGLQFAAIYPMSPASGILHTLALYQEKYGYIYKQPEDEIAAINMAIGASFAGARSLTSTSGGGFALMTEGYGLAGMSETPVVIVDGMRGGPATGMPTWSEQGDLNLVLHGGQGDFPRIVLAAGDAQEAYYLTIQAFDLADKYQTPVVILLDKNLCDNDQSFAPWNIPTTRPNRGKFITQKIDNYQRYADSSDGISPRAIPGSGNHVLATSYEHNAAGFATEEITDRNSQMDRRLKKMTACQLTDMPKPVMFGPPEAETTIVSWGSNKGAILEVLRNHPNVNYLHLTWMSPFPGDAVKEILGKAKRILNVECNQMAQMAGLIREKTGIEIKENLLKYDGRPIYPEEIAEKL